MTDSFPGVIRRGVLRPRLDHEAAIASRNLAPLAPLPLREALWGAGLHGDRQGDLGGQPQGEMRAEQDEKDCTDRRSESAFQDSILQDVAGCRSSRRSARTIPTQAFRPKCRFLIELATTAWDAAVPRRSPNSP